MVYLLMISEDTLKIISDSQRLMQAEASLKAGMRVILGDRQRILADQLRVVSDRRGIEDKQMVHLNRLKKHCQSIAISMSFRM